MMKTTIMERHPPPNFFAPQPAAIPRRSLLIFPPFCRNASSNGRCRRKDQRVSHLRFQLFVQKFQHPVERRFNRRVPHGLIESMSPAGQRNQLMSNSVAFQLLGHQYGLPVRNIRVVIPMKQQGGRIIHADIAKGAERIETPGFPVGIMSDQHHGP